MRVIDTFSGIGGFSLGLERVGFETVAFVEVEPYCRAVLAKHWPDVPQYGDIRDVTAEQLRADGVTADVITGGFPCQDISNAGKQAGIEGERSGLWSELARLIGEVRPAYAILENVTALISGDSGRWFGRVLGDLAAIGYDAEWHCISAAHVGAPHLRDRIWIIAYPQHSDADRTGSHREEVDNRRLELVDQQGRFAGSLREILADPIGFGVGTDARAQSRSETEREELQQENGQALPDDADQARPVLADTVNAGQQPGGRSRGSGESSETWNDIGRSGEDVADAGREGVHQQGGAAAAGTGGGESGRVCEDGVPDRGKEAQRDLADTERERLQTSGDQGALHERRPRISDRFIGESNVADADSERGCRGPTWHEDAKDARQSPGCEKHGGWLVEPPVCGVVDGVSTGLDGYQGRVASGVPNRVARLRALGNAIVPQIAEAIFAAINDVELR